MIIATNRVKKMFCCYYCGVDLATVSDYGDGNTTSLPKTKTIIHITSK